MRIALPPEESGVQFFDEEGVLEALHHPVDDGDDHFNIQIFAEFTPLEAKAHKGNPAVGVFGDQEAVDLALQGQVRPVVPQQVDAVGNPILAHHVLGADQPVTQHVEETAFPHFGRHVQVSRE